MVTICNKDIPNELNELTIQQFEDITEIHANETRPRRKTLRSF